MSRRSLVEDLGHTHVGRSMTDTRSPCLSGQFGQVCAPADRL